MKKIILTGATGFIGSNFAEYLTCKGIKVLALGRKDFKSISKIRQKKLKNTEYINLDMRNISELKQILDLINWNYNESVFFNLAWGGKDKLSDLNIERQYANVSWSMNSLEIAKELGCSRFIQIGTMEEAFAYKYLDLDHNNNSEYNRHLIYSLAKIASKNSLKARASQLGIDYLYVLHSHVMGPDDDKDSFLQVTLKKLKFGEDLIFSSGEQIFDVISLKDCCKGYFLICTKGLPSKEYWVGSGTPRKLKEYVKIMYQLYPSKVKLEFGKLPYNDVKLSKKDFSIQELKNDTGYFPSSTYQEVVKELHDYLFKPN